MRAPGWDTAAAPRHHGLCGGHAGRLLVSEAAVTAPSGAVQCGCVAQTRLVK